MTNDDTQSERDLRDAVQAYGAQVQPADRLGEIRRATLTQPRARWRQPWLLTAGAALITAAVVLGAVAIAGSDRPAGQVSATPGDQRDVTVYEVGAVGGELWLYPRTVTTADTGDRALDSVRALLTTDPGDGTSGPRTRSSLWAPPCAPGAGVRFVDVTSAAITVALSNVSSDQPRAARCDLGQRGANAQLQQLAWTVHDATGSSAPVTLDVDGHRFSPQPVAPDPSALSPVLLDSPAAGTTVSSPVTVRGRGNTFEANVQWQVREAAGAVVEQGNETAGSYGHFRPFSFSVDLAAGDYTVRVFETSPEDGAVSAQDTVSFSVS